MHVIKKNKNFKNFFEKTLANKEILCYNLIKMCGKATHQYELVNKL